MKNKNEKGCGKRIRYRDINLKCGENVGDIGVIIPIYCKKCRMNEKTDIEIFEEEVRNLSKEYRKQIREAERKFVEEIKNERN